MDKSENFATCFSVSFDHFLISAGRRGGRWVKMMGDWRNTDLHSNPTFKLS